jgi:hypothetical protein
MAYLIEKWYYQALPIWNAVRTELKSTHYRLLSQIEDEGKRRFYTRPRTICFGGGIGDG